MPGPAGPAEPGSSGSAEPGPAGSGADSGVGGAAARRLAVVVRPVRKSGIASLFRRKPPAPEEPALTLGPRFFAVLARVPEGWTRTLDALPPADGEVVFGPLEIRMAVTELSRISPYAETSDEQADFDAFRTLVGNVPEHHELVFTPS